MSTLPATMTRAAFARLRGVDKSHITRLAQSGRLVLTDDGKLVRVVESIARLADTEDPSKDGVRERFADKRGEAAAVQAALTPPEPNNPASAAVAGGAEAPATAPPGPGASVMDARHDLIREQAHRARLQREELEGRLVDADAVKRATFDKARIARNALFGMVDVISSRLAAESNPAKVHDMLSSEIRRVCDELSAGEQDQTRQ